MSGFEKGKTRYGMVIDLDKCNGCGACVTSCQSENNIPPSNPELADARRSIRWMDLMPMTEGKFPHVTMRMLPRPCMHCEHPPCVKVCPVRATYFSEETGIVGQIYYRCIGCRYCTTACPYTVRYFNWFPQEWPEPFDQMQNPDVTVRSKGVVEKCTFCHHRLLKAREDARVKGRKILPGEYNTACAQSCPTGAITFGELSDPKSEVSKQARSKRAFKLLEDLGTEPKVIYLREGE